MDARKLIVVAIDTTIATIAAVRHIFRIHDFKARLKDLEKIFGCTNLDLTNKNAECNFIETAFSVFCYLRRVGRNATARSCVMGFV